MDLAVLAALTARAPLAIRAPSDITAAQFDLAQTCAAFGLECATIDPPDLPAAASDRRFAELDVLIVRNLHSASRAVQARAVDLLKARAGDDVFLLVFLGSGFTDACGTGLTPLLNDFVLLMHTHDSDDPPPDPAPSSKARLLELQASTARVRVAPDVFRYSHDIPTHLRLHRAVGGGVSAVATRQLGLLSRVLAVLNGLDFVTPALVGMAARKVYPHRIRITPAHKERSLQWGSDMAAVAEALEGITPEDVVEDVLRTVEPPL